MKHQKVLRVPEMLRSVERGRSGIVYYAFNYLLSGKLQALHVPVVNIPGFVGDHGMPIGLSLVTGRYEDRRLLKVAAAVAVVFEGGGWKSTL
jgi:hypothetical protein